MIGPASLTSMIVAGLASATWWVPLMAFVIVAIGAIVALRVGGRYEDVDEGAESEDLVASDDPAEMVDPPSEEGSPSR